MKKNRILSLVCAVLLMLSFALPACALIAVQDADGNIHYSTDETTTEAEAVQKNENLVKFAQAVQSFWRRWGVLTVAGVLVGAIVIAIVVSESERQKKTDAEREARKPKKKK